MCFGKSVKRRMFEVCIVGNAFRMQSSTMLTNVKLRLFAHFLCIKLYHSVSTANVMNIFQRFVYTLNRPVDWKRSSHENTDQWRTIKAGDVVEAAIENTSNILYRVEEVLPHSNEARVVRLGAKNEELERYTLALVMLRPLKVAKKK
jgi:hypothetical protein